MVNQKFNKLTKPQEQTRQNRRNCCAKQDHKEASPRMCMMW